MIIFVFFAVVVSVILVMFQFADDIANFQSRSVRESLKDLLEQSQAKNSRLEANIARFTTEYNSVKRQLEEAQEKEGEFITKIFDQRKELDLKG